MDQISVDGSLMDSRGRAWIVGSISRVSWSDPPISWPLPRRAGFQPGGRHGDMFNPLYIFSNVGLGKTHLIQAVAHAGLESGRRVIYLTAEKFMYGFVSALKA